jgi:ubiquinone/menaquinone biosynthesis C-methylase UbiE
MNQQIRSILVCPRCRGDSLSEREQAFVCGDCRSSYPIIDGIPMFLPEDLGDFKRGEVAYHSDGVSSFDEIHRLDQLRNRYYHDEALRSILRMPKGALVLELAGGLGHDAQKLMVGGMNLVETDIALECVREARERSQASNLPSPDLHATYMVTDVESLPFAAASFDAVYICAALHHLPDPLAGLKQMRACVKQDGLVVVSMEPNAWPYYAFYPIILPLSWRIAALARLITKPREFVQTSRLVRALRAKLTGADSVERREPQTRGESPGDESTKGFSARGIRRLLNAADLEPVRLQRVFYVNGLIQEVPRLRQVRLSAGIERRLIAVDETLARVPFLRRLNWFWNIVARPKTPNLGSRDSASWSGGVGQKGK